MVQKILKTRLVNSGQKPQNEKHMTLGYSTSTKRRINVVRGRDAASSSDRSKTAPVATGVTIYSGQVISLNDDGEWVLGAAAGVPAYFALKHSTDGDVVSSGKLEAIAASGQFVIETAYYSGNGLVAGVPVKAGTSTAVGDVVAAAYDEAGDIIGYVEAAAIDLNDLEPPAAAEASNGKVIRIATTWGPARVIVI